MHEGTRRTAHDVASGARAMMKRERRPFRASGSHTPLDHRRTNVLPHYESPGALHAAAHRQAVLARGRERFVLGSRVVAVGVPLGIAAGVLAWRSGRSSRGRSLSQFVVAFAATLGLTYLEAVAEWRGMEEADDA